MSALRCSVAVLAVLAVACDDEARTRDEPAPKAGELAPDAALQSWAAGDPGTGLATGAHGSQGAAVPQAIGLGGHQRDPDPDAEVDAGVDAFDVAAPREPGPRRPAGRWPPDPVR